MDLTGEGRLDFNALSSSDFLHVNLHNGTREVQLCRRPCAEMTARDAMLSLKELSIIASLVGASTVLVWRVQEGRSAVTLRKILIPPFGMATGFSMFVVRDFRLPLLWAVGAFLLGAIVLAYPLLRTSRLVRDGEAIMMQRSNAFFGVVIALAAVRVLAHGYIDRFVDVKQTAALFFVLAFGMILRWRLWMFFEYRQLMSKTP
jgi:membrane protein CcdC involved in cytochrome C biogenesis